MCCSLSDIESQLKDFEMFYDNGEAETLFYENTGVEYNSGTFVILIDPTITASSIIIRRPVVLTLCEVEVFGGGLSKQLLVYLSDLLVMNKKTPRSFI